MAEAEGVARVAALSGGSSGIGKAIAAEFCRRGWKVALGARGMDRVQATVGELRADGGEAIGLALDITDPASIDRFYDDAAAQLGKIDLVVNCAAHARPGAIWDRPAEDVVSEVAAGLTGALLFARRGVRDMIDGAVRGDVLFISSTTAAVPWPYLSVYAATKAGVEQAARTMSLELEGTGIRSLIVRVGNTLGTDWANSWEGDELAVGARWGHFGVLRHDGYMQPENVALAVANSVSMPRGFQLDLVSVHPEAPVEDVERAQGHVQNKPLVVDGKPK